MNEISYMLYITIVLFVFATMMGALMVTRQLSKEVVSKEVMYPHTILAGLSLALLLIYSFQNPDNYPKTSVILFSIAGLLGIYMFMNFLKGKNNPLVVDILYGLLAMCGFVSLVIFVFGDK